MPIKVSHQSFADCETLTIHGAKQSKGNPTNTVRLQFNNLDDLKKFQNELNNLFPENVTVNEKFKEPKEEGYYLSQTGILLLKDEWGWSVIRFKDSTAPCLAWSTPNLHLINGLWVNVIEQLTKVALPLTRVNITPFSE
jgi:hypothetical protein